MQPAAKADTFAEKLVDVIVKNLQVSIKDIHIRFEDDITNPMNPFTMGITLSGFYFKVINDFYFLKKQKSHCNSVVYAV